MKDPIGRAGRKAIKGGVRIELASADARVLCEILTKDLHQLEAEVAGNDWQDLGEAVVRRESLLRRLVGDLSD